MSSKKDLYQHLKQVFSLANYFADNLDSLWDLLNEENEETSIIFLNVHLAREGLGDYAEKFIQLLNQLAEENNLYHVYLYE